MEAVTGFISQYGLIAIFLVVLLEYACFPIASEIVLPFAGALAVQGNIGFVPVLLTSILAGILGSLICYAIGRYGGQPLVEKIIRKFPKTKNGIHSSYEKFNKYASASVGLTRLIPLCRTYISFVAGTCKQRMTSFLLFSTIGITAWNFILVGLGYILGSNWTRVMTYYHEFKLIIIPSALILAVVFAAVLYLRHKKSGKV